MRIRRNRVQVQLPGGVRVPRAFYSAIRIPKSAMITYSFPGKIVLVTGSSRGIGAASLTQFARAGATCVLHYWDDPGGANRRDAEALAGSLAGSAVHLVAADVRDAGQV